MSTYPSITETFIAREIEEVVNGGNKVNLCILRPQLPIFYSKAMKVRNVNEIRFTHRFFTSLYITFIVFFNSPRLFTQVFLEAVNAIFRNPSRSHHILYFMIAAMKFSNRKELRRAEYIHCHFLHSEAITARWLSILLKIPYGITAHISKTRFNKITMRKVVADAEICIGDTNETITLLAKLGNPNGILIRNSVNIKQINYNASSMKLDENGTKLVILAVGTFIHCKGFHVLIKACGILKQMGFSFKCKIFGEGVERKKLMELMRELALEDYLELPGAIQIEGLFEEYQRSDIFVMPSIPSSSGTDGLPTVIIESLASGLPVIGSRHAAIPDIIINGETGLLVNPDDEKGLADAIVKLMEDKALYNYISVNGRKKVENEYDIVKNSLKFIELINSISSN